MGTEEQNLKRTLSQNIKKRRTALGLSQEKLAEISDLSLQTINGIEGCRLWVSARTMVKLSRALRIEAHELLTPDLDLRNPLPDALPLETLLNLQHNLQKSLQKSVKKCLDTQFLAVLYSDSHNG